MSDKDQCPEKRRVTCTLVMHKNIIDYMKDELAKDEITLNTSSRNL